LLPLEQPNEQHAINIVIGIIQHSRIANTEMNSLRVACGAYGRKLLGSSIKITNAIRNAKLAKLTRR
jgi:hypothetical protein